MIQSLDLLYSILQTIFYYSMRKEILLNVCESESQSQQEITGTLKCTLGNLGEITIYGINGIEGHLKRCGEYPK